MYFLAVAAIFKNESAAIKEWINHYKNEGVEHFYLIDNGSTDDYKKEVEDPLSQGIITLFSDDKKHAQVELYNLHFKRAFDESKWLIICDLDEFIYARRGFSTISEYLKTLSPSIGQIHIPWKMFGSSGFIKQPDSILNSFTRRYLYTKENKAKNEELIKKFRFSKTIVRCDAVVSLHVHSSVIKEKYREIRANNKRINFFRLRNPVLFESALSNMYLHLNHYPIQSLEWFENVKITRVDVNYQTLDKLRDLAYFKKYDEQANMIIDDELASKVYIK
jgi:hypothetical protein